MKDYLQDIVQHTHALGGIDVIKVTGDATSTIIESVAEDRSIILDAKFKNPVPEFVGLFGMPNLGKLNTILNIPEYKEDAQISINTHTNNGVTVPSGLHFENKGGDFKNDYRFMSADVINGKLKKAIMRAVKWNVDFAPSVASIQKLKFQASANSEETSFIAKTDGNKLKFFFGDATSHAGDFVFRDGVTGTLSKSWNFPIAQVIGILSLNGDKTMRISDDGVMEISIDTGIAEYNYKLPALSK